MYFLRVDTAVRTTPALNKLRLWHGFWYLRCLKSMSGMTKRSMYLDAL
jgi:hypothetical protein